MKPKVEAWAHRLRTLGKIAKRHPQSSYASLGMSLQLEWQYLKMTVPVVGTLMVLIEENPRDIFFPSEITRPIRYLGRVLP